MSESTPFMFTQAIQPSDSTQFVKGVTDLAKQKQAQALMDLERAKQNAAQIANETAGYKIDAIPEAWRGEWENYLNTEKAQITELYSSNDQDDFQEALERLSKLSNLYTSLSTATPESVSSNIETLKSLQDPMFKNRYDRELGIFNNVDDSNLAEQVAKAESGIQNPFENYEFKIVDGQPAWVNSEGDTKNMNDYITTLSNNAQNYGPKINMVSPKDLSGLSEIIIDDFEIRNKDWNEDDANKRVEAYMTGEANTEKKKMFRYSIMSEFGFDEGLTDEQMESIMNGKWENDVQIADAIKIYMRRIAEDSNFNSKSKTTTTTTEASGDDQGPGI